jgi:hypothetical protein
LDRDGDTPVGNKSNKLDVQMGIPSAKTIRASRHIRLHNRPDIRLQPRLLNLHIHEFLQSGRCPYKTFP